MIPQLGISEELTNMIVVQVKQIPFFWDLIMSQKRDALGNIVGPYETNDLRAFWFPEKTKKDHRRKRLRDLHYDLIWEITEMQVKVYVQAIFPSQVGPPLSQLAKEQALGPDEKTVTGESRSKALDKDIEIANGGNEEAEDDNDEDASEEERHDAPNETRIQAGSQQSSGLAREHEQQVEVELSSRNSRTHQQMSRAEGQTQVRPHGMMAAEVQQPIQSQMNSAPSGILRQSATSQGLPQDNTQRSAAASSSNNSRTDGRRRDGK